MSLQAVDIIDEIRRRAELDPDVVILWLYGSRATQMAHADSDYDFAVAFDQFPQDATIRKLRPAQLALTWSAQLDVPSDKISIVDINLAPIPLAGEIINKGHILVCKDELRRYREESRISSMIELDWEYHKSRYG